MKKAIAVKDADSARKALINIGNEIIEKAYDITNNLDGVNNITINCEIYPNSIVKYEITKEYTLLFEDSDENNN